MSTSNYARTHADNNQQFPVDYPRLAVPPIYPSSGAFTHLPIRQTIIGSPALPHPNANKIFLRNLQAHCYSLPEVALNFTIVEILVFLPNWFKNKAICSRFMNNNLTAHVHFAIMGEYRNLGLMDEYERDKARKTLTDEYRKTMRGLYPGWTKAKHTAQAEWDPWFMDLGGFMPDDVRLTDYRRPAPIPFRDLMRDVKKMPAGVHAGDLTRALEFALAGQYDLYFPDDLPSILEQTGRTQITMAHTDRSIIRNFAEKVPSLGRFKQSLPTSKLDGRVESRESPASLQILAYQENLRPEEMPAIQGQLTSPQAQALPSPAYGIEPPTQLQPQIMANSPNSQAENHVPKPAHTGLSSDELEMEAILREHFEQDANDLSTPPISPTYVPRFLLRDCVEGDLAFDGSPLARAARFAQRPDQVHKLWCVEDVP